MNNIPKLLIEYLDDRNLGDGNLETMTLQEYKCHVRADHFLFVDGHGFLMDDFTCRRFAASQEQLDIFIEYLQEERKRMSKHDKRFL